MTNIEMNLKALEIEKQKVAAAKWELNGNSFVKESHVFKYGEGVYFESKESARLNTRLANKTGIELKEIEVFGKKWYKFTFSNLWD